MFGIAGWLTSWLRADTVHTDAPAALSPAVAPVVQKPDQPDPFSLPVWNEGLSVYEEFEVERQLGAGSLGPVYLLRNTTDERRYIVKRVRFSDNGTRNEFLAYLQTWVYLPEHPHLGACRFIRVNENEADVFSEPMEGVCLKEFIQTGKLYVGDTRVVQERILDIAIQLAWGLQALEDLKLLHGNLKPTDVFISSQGIARITSMGLAHATAHALRTDGTPAGGPSPVYASPEVTDGGEITETSDLWCWGLLVFEMFAGAVTWGEAPPEPPKEEAEPEPQAKVSLDAMRALGRTPEWGGRTALAALGRYLQGAPPAKPLPVMPPAVITVLKRCFASRAEDRWTSATEVAQALRTAYRALLGQEHARHVPTAVHHCNQLIVAHARWSRASGAQWLTLREWEERIQRAMGQPTPVRSKRTNEALGLKVQAEHDHATLYALQQRCEKLIAEGHPELRHELAGVCIDHGFLHVGLKSVEKALECFDKAIAIWETLVRREGREDLEHDLAMALLNRGIALKQMGRLDESLAGYEQAIQLWQNQIGQKGRRELAATLGWAEASRAKVRFKLAAKERFQALGLSHRAQELRTRTQEQSAELRTLRGRVATLRAQIETLNATRTSSTEKGTSSSEGIVTESKEQRVEREMALQAARTELMKAEEVLQAGEKLETAAKAKQQEASAADAGAKSLQKRAETEARAALSVLQAEVKRTDREDARAVLHWAQRAFEGLL